MRSLVLFFVLRIFNNGVPVAAPKSLQALMILNDRQHPTVQLLISTLARRQSAVILHHHWDSAHVARRVVVRFPRFPGGSRSWSDWAKG
jgi:hypothetical protein